MSHDNAWVSPTGPPEPLPAPRPVHEVFADTATTEQYILGRGIHTPVNFAAVLSRPHKSAAMLAALSIYVTDLSYADLNATTAMLVALLGEPGLHPATVHGIVRVMRFHGSPATPLLMAVCAHPSIEAHTLAAVLWRATPQQSLAVAMATRKLGVAAVAWVRARDSYAAGPTPTELAAVEQTQVRWAYWADGNPARFAFLLTSSHAFDSEDDMLAAGAAVCADPGVSFAVRR